MQDAQSGLLGFVDAAGEWATPGAATKFAELGNLEMDDGGATRRGLAAAKDLESGLWGFVGEDSSWVINPMFADAGVAAGAGMPAADVSSL